MRFTEAFDVKRGRADDWFDPILDADTRLFVDPFLIYRETVAPWKTSHARIIEHVQHCFVLIGKAGLNDSHPAYRKAIALLRFPEPVETCLGYASTGTRGSGVGHGFARAAGEAIAFCIREGLQDLRHFEELVLFQEGIGPDRISDTACTILKPTLVAYTQQVAKRHGVPLRVHELPAGRYDPIRDSWVPARVALPTNPATDGPVLLVPERFLDDLPELDAYNWWDYYQQVRLREDFNYDVATRVDKKTIVDAARNRPDIVSTWIDERENAPGHPYDLNRDRLGVYQWDPASSAYVTSHPLELPKAKDDTRFLEALELLVNEFGSFVKSTGWKILWDGPNLKHESTAQILFRGVSRLYCRQNNIDVNAEVDLGSGCVDFKFSTGYEHRALLEVKHVANGKFWNGLELQLPAYLESEGVKDGWLVAIWSENTTAQMRRIAELPARVDAINASHSLRVRIAVVDARRKPSASKLT